MKNRDFIYKGVKYHLNDNIKNEFEGKYNLLFYNDSFDRWQKIITCDSKKEAIAYIKENYLYI